MVTVTEGSAEKQPFVEVIFLHGRFYIEDIDVCHDFFGATCFVCMYNYLNNLPRVDTCLLCFTSAVI